VLRFEEQTKRGQERGLTRADFAKRIGVSPNYLYAGEYGRDEVGAEVLLVISRVFGKSLECTSYQEATGVPGNSKPRASNLDW